MNALIGLVTSENQISIKKLNVSNQEIESKIVDTIELNDYPFNLLLTPNSDELDVIEDKIKIEQKFYPVITSDQVGINNDSFEQMSFEDLYSLYLKVNSRWVLNNNIFTIEQLYSTVNYLKDLYINDRDNFFEELWFILKSNLATTDLSIIYHDIYEEKGKKEKNERPKLIHSVISGTKIPNITPASQEQEMLMKEYESEFGEFFEITEYNPGNGQLVATVKINLSPILIMANINGLNQLQKSILISIFSGLQPE